MYTFVCIYIYISVYIERKRESYYMYKRSHS